MSIFSPYTDSFLLVRGAKVKSSFPIFLPNTDSFILVRGIVGRTVLSSEVVNPVRSKAANGVKVADTISQSVESTDSEQSKIKDHNKRNFLKVAGVVGASAIASQLVLPKKASAFVLGSSPTTGVVGVKDSANARINPATEETLDEVLKTADLTFDAGALEVKVTSASGEGSSSFSNAAGDAKSGLVDVDRHVQVDVLSSELPSSASTETTLQAISFGGFKFTVHVDTVGAVDYIGEASVGTATSAASWRIKKVDSTTGIIIQWAGTGVFDQVWDNRASLSYS